MIINLNPREARGAATPSPVSTSPPAPTPPRSRPGARTDLASIEARSQRAAAAVELATLGRGRPWEKVNAPIGAFTQPEAAAGERVTHYPRSRPGAGSRRQGRQEPFLCIQAGDARGPPRPRIGHGRPLRHPLEAIWRGSGDPPPGSASGCPARAPPAAQGRRQGSGRVREPPTGRTHGRALAGPLAAGRVQGTDRRYRLAGVAAAVARTPGSPRRASTIGCTST
jgi:hypothetical protein